MSTRRQYDIEVVEVDGESLITLRPQLDFGVSTFSHDADGVTLMGEGGMRRHFLLDEDSVAMLAGLDEILVMEYAEGSNEPLREIICSRAH